VVFRVSFQPVSYTRALRPQAAERLRVLRRHLENLGVEVRECVACVSDSLLQGYHGGHCVRLIGLEAKAVLRRRNRWKGGEGWICRGVRGSGGGGVCDNG
jgi:hypothetical protein